MCGIAGFLDFRRRNSNQQLRAVALGMARTMRHRGPDDEGVWADAEAGVALAMRRLAIVDVSPAGHQPMHSSSGRYTLITNGEIYNCEELRELCAQDLGVAFRGHSDTEVMLAAFERWGVREALCRFNGMFAFALWDSAQRKLHLARDRFGEKPLYYSCTPSGVIFGSELKALRLHPEFDQELSRDAIALYLRRNCIPCPHSIYKHTAKLPPGTLLSLSETNFHNAVPDQYWSATEAALRAQQTLFPGDDTEAAAELDLLLRDSVLKRMRSNVPLGAFLSGGIDSSTVVAIMQMQRARPVKTFTIGIADSNYDEAPQAALVAKCLDTDHTELYVTPAEAWAVIPELPSMYDEPFADSSQIPTHLVARLARQQVTVCLSGDGGDELFGGYNRYLWGPRLARTPLTLRKWTGRALTRIATHEWDKLFDYVNPVLPSSMRPRMPGYKLHKLATVLPYSDIESLYSRLTSHWIDPGTVLGTQQIPLPTTKGIGLDAAEHMMLLDTLSYLPDDILAKLDRATMAVGLESRTPFLDARVYEFAWRLPSCMKIRHGKGKWILRQVLQKYVPQQFVNRPKAGFGIPLDRWLAGPLRDWCESLLCESRLRQDGIFNPGPIRKMWAAYLAGETYWTWHLWDVLMFQAWMDANGSTRQQPQPEFVSPLP